MTTSATEAAGAGDATRGGPLSEFALSILSLRPKLDWNGSESEQESSMAAGEVAVDVEGRLKRLRRFGGLRNPGDIAVAVAAAVDVVVVAESVLRRTVLLGGGIRVLVLTRRPPSSASLALSSPELKCERV